MNKQCCIEYFSHISTILNDHAKYKLRRSEQQKTKNEKQSTINACTERSRSEQRATLALSISSTLNINVVEVNNHFSFSIFNF
jgi:hypothetical protein